MTTKKPQQIKYPDAWPGPSSADIMPRSELDTLRCSEPGCERDWQSEGGLAHIGSGIWRCAGHRDTLDHSSHRLDLREAQQRATDLALSTQRTEIAARLRHEPAQDVHNWLMGWPPAQ